LEKSDEWQADPLFTNKYNDFDGLCLSEDDSVILENSSDCKIKSLISSLDSIIKSSLLDSQSNATQDENQNISAAMFEHRLEHTTTNLDDFIDLIPSSNVPDNSLSCPSPLSSALSECMSDVSSPFSSDCFSYSSDLGFSDDLYSESYNELFFTSVPVNLDSGETYL